MKRKGSGVIEFSIICVLVLFMLIVSIIMPLASPTYSTQPYAFVLIVLSLILPYLFFFIWGGKALSNLRNKK